MNSESQATRQRIIGAAETLFALHGFAGASLRLVTAAAKVNVAAVNYHFGSKENLIFEVLRRRLDKLNDERLDALQAVCDQPGYDLEEVLNALIRPALAFSTDAKDGVVFVRLIARAYAEQNTHLRQFLHENYGHVLKQFALAIGAMLPKLDKQELYWRLDIINNALNFTMADVGMIKRRGESTEAHRDLTAEHLIRFAAAGLRAS